MSNQTMANVEHLGPDVDYQDTIGLLQEEIARLEEELRVRDEARAQEDEARLRDPIEARREPEPVQQAEDGSSADDLPRLEELAAEIARRDETISLLLEEIQHIEEAAAAGRAEWEQLNQWVEQVEQRVDSRDETDSRLAEELATEKRKAEELRQTAATEKRALEKTRKALEEEVVRLRAQLSSVASKAPDKTNSDLALAALEGENLRLRKVNDGLTRAAAAAGEVVRVKADLAATRKAYDEAEIKLRTLEDEIARERKEHEAELAAVRSQMAREPLQRREAPAEVASAAAAAAASASATAINAGPRDLTLVSAEERMMAFRQHLQDVHRREQEENSQKRLSARLSRLWRRTGPTS